MSATWTNASVIDPADIRSQLDISEDAEEDELTNRASRASIMSKDIDFIIGLYIGAEEEETLKDMGFF